MERKPKVLVVDDHMAAREGIHSMLDSDHGVEDVGEAGSGEEAGQRVVELRPDVVLMDIRMPGMSGIEATRQIKKSVPTTSVIMLTIYDSEVYVVEGIPA